MISAGFTGVSFFYILSGFVLAWSARPETSPGTFYRRRFARIYPAYFMAWMGSIVLLAGSVRLADLAAPTLLQAWVPVEAIYFSGWAVFWSLSCEAFFYLVFPLLITGMRGLGRRGLVTVGGGCIGLSVAFAIAALPFGSLAAVRFITIFPPTRLPEFVLGMVLALLMKDGVRWSLDWRLAATLSLGAVVVASNAPDELSRVVVTLVPFALLTWSAAQADIAGEVSVLRSRPLVVLGMWSYCFYLVHAQTQYALSGILQRIGVDVRDMAGISLLATIGVSLLLSLLAAYLLHAFIERPAEIRLRPNERARVD